MAPTEAPTTAEELLNLAAAVYDEHIERALTFSGWDLPHDGFWRNQNYMGVEILHIKKGNSVVEILRYPSDSDRDLAIREFGESEEALTIKRSRSGAMSAFTHWKGSRIPVSEIPGASIVRVSELITSQL
jgi:hypothetical protein